MDVHNQLPLQVAVPKGLQPLFPKLVVPVSNPITKGKYELGRQLYFDPRISLDGTVKGVFDQFSKTSQPEPPRPDVLYSEDFEATPEFGLPAGWRADHHTTTNANTLDPDDPRSNLYLTWTVVSAERLGRGASAARRLCYRVRRSMSARCWGYCSTRLARVASSKSSNMNPGATV